MCKRSNEWIHISLRSHFQSMEQNNPEHPVDIKHLTDPPGETHPPSHPSAVLVWTFHPFFMNRHDNIPYIHSLCAALNCAVKVYFDKIKEKKRGAMSTCRHVWRVPNKRSKKMVNLPVITSIIWCRSRGSFVLDTTAHRANSTVCCLGPQNPCRK